MKLKNLFKRKKENGTGLVGRTESPSSSKTQGQESLKTQGQEPPKIQGQESPKTQGQEPPKTQGQEFPKIQGQESRKTQGQESPKTQELQPQNSSQGGLRKDNDAGISFRIRAEKTSWPPVRLPPTSDSPMTAAGHLLLDFANGTTAQWCHGEYNAPRSGEELLRPKEMVGKECFPKDLLPPLLFDLQTRRVVSAAEVAPARYTFISHVWGRTIELDGSRYNVGWKIPIRSEEKLEQILEAARVLVAERFIWMDVLCLDQSKRDNSEVGRMGTYLENSAGCLVWLDNEGVETSAWDEVLDAIAGVNEFFKLDKNGIPMVSFTEWNYGGFTTTQSSGKWLQSLQRCKKIELAPWFRRVWTLQEGTIPNEMFFCTPERYVTSGFYLFSMVGLCELMAQTYFDLGDMMAVGLNSELQSSELFKMRALRQLYRREGISFWHLVHAVKSRSCTYERDRVWGVLGLLKHHNHAFVSLTDSERGLSHLYDDLFKACVNNGDFYACLYLGQAKPLVEKDASCNGLLASPPLEVRQAGNLSWTPTGTEMRHVGVTPVENIWIVTSYGALSVMNGMQRSVHELDMDVQKDVAKAFNTSTTVQDGWCPGALAGVSALQTTSGLSEAIQSLGEEISRLFEESRAKGIHSWINAIRLCIDIADFSVAVVWSELNDPQLAVLTDFPGGSMRLVMHPYSTRGHSDGCIVATVQSDGSLRKIGVGLGTSLRASSTSSFLLACTVSDDLARARLHAVTNQQP